MQRSGYDHMENTTEEFINIGIVGGGQLARDVLEKTYFDYSKVDVGAKIIAIADPDSSGPGVEKARELGLKVTADYRKFFLPEFNIHLIMVLTPEKEVFEKISFCTR